MIVLPLKDLYRILSKDDIFILKMNLLTDSSKFKLVVNYLTSIYWSQFKSKLLTHEGISSTQTKKNFTGRLAPMTSQGNSLLPSTSKVNFLKELSFFKESRNQNCRSNSIAVAKLI